CTWLTTNTWPKPVDPPALQFPADPQDTELMEASSPAVRPGTPVALPQRPRTSLTTNAALKDSSSYPTALQFPADAQDTELPRDPPSEAATVIALRQRPFTWLTTKGSVGSGSSGLSE